MLARPTRRPTRHLPLLALPRAGRMTSRAGALRRQALSGCARGTGLAVGGMHCWGFLQRVLCLGGRASCGST